MKRLIAAGMILAAGTVGLTACSSAKVTDPGGTSQQDSATIASIPHWVDLPNGRRVMCVYETRYAKDGGTSCDWEHVVN